MIVAKGIKVVYKAPGGVPFCALDIEEMSLPETGLVALLGESGSGKTTLIKVLSLLQSPNEGEISYDNQPIASGKEVRKNNAFVSQEGGLIEDLSVLDNLSFLDVKQEDLEKRLDQLGLKENANALVGSLSGGEKQRVAIARCLLQNADNLFLDEPTAHLDRAIATKVFSIIKEEARKHLIVVSCHDEKMAKGYADQWFRLSSGKIVAASSKSESVATQEVLNSEQKPRRSLKNYAKFLWNSFKIKHARTLGSLILGSATLTLFGLANSLLLFDETASFARVLSSEKMHFIPLSFPVKNTMNGESFLSPIRGDSKQIAEGDFNAVSPFAMGKSFLSDEFLYLLPYRSGLSFNGRTLSEPGHGECATTEYVKNLLGERLNLTLFNQYSSSSSAFDITETFEAESKLTENEDPASFSENLSVIINENDFRSLFSIDKPVSIPASDLLAPSTLENSVYTKRFTKYSPYGSQSLSSGRAPKEKGEIVLSSRYVKESARSEIEGSSLQYRDLNVPKTQVLYNQYVQFSYLFGNMKVVGISDEENSDIYLFKDDARTLSEELLYFSGGFVAYNIDSASTAKSLASSTTKPSNEIFGKIYEFSEIRSSSLFYLMIAGSVLSGILFELNMFTFISTILHFRQKELVILDSLGFSTADFFLGFSLAFILLGLSMSFLGISAASGIVYLLNLNAFGVPLLSLSWVGILIVLCVAIFPIVPFLETGFGRESKPRNKTK